MRRATLPLLVLLAANASAAESTTPMRIESCVSQDAIQIGSTDQHATLDADEQSQVLAEMERRYPALAQHGFPVSKIMLWQKTGGDAVFITLLDHPRKAQERCFTATFAAGRFDGITLLRRKYLRPEMAI
jgi:hypothetical protein